ncbi:MAG: HEAT repeat domain-containing protein [candidate division Zixibacteria bacterium]|nr:HEAT repeat domain-containing protein [candidate division Zixibacteria bacterium]
MNLGVDKRQALIKDIRFILKDLLKVIKVVSMYPEDNPLPQSLKQSFAERLESLSEEYGDIAISVEKDLLKYESEVVYEDRGGDDRLAGIFFETGITDFTFKDGLDVNEVFILLDVIKKYMNCPDKSLDLAALIWESGVTNFTFGTIEDIVLSQYDGSFNLQAFMDADDSGHHRQVIFGTDTVENYAAIFDQHTESSEIDLNEPEAPGSSVLLSGSPGVGGLTPSLPVPGQKPPSVFDIEGMDEIAARTSEAAAAMGLNDLPVSSSRGPDTTLILNDEFRLSEEEEEITARLCTEDAQFDIYDSTQSLLKEILHQEADFRGFSEAVTICEKVLNEFVLAGKLIQSGQLLQYIIELESRLRSDKPRWADRLRDATVMAGSRDRLKALAEGLNKHPETGVRELARYLDNFDWQALSGITDLLGDFEHRTHRETLCDFLTKKGTDNLDLVSQGIFDKRWYVVRNSISILARIGSDRALELLKRTLDHEDERVRMALVQELKECPNDRALELLTAAVRDRDAQIRTEAVNSIIARRGRPAFEAVEAAISEENLATLDQPDRMALLKAYSILGGEAAVPFLSQLILRPNLFRERLVSDLRAAAFEALCHNRSEKCERTLLKLSRNWRPDIKGQAGSALRRRREIIYGGD